MVEAEAEACEVAEEADVIAVVIAVVAGLVVASVVDDTAVVPSVVEDTAVVASVVEDTAFVVEETLSVVEEASVTDLARQPLIPCPKPLQNSLGKQSASVLQLLPGAFGFRQLWKTPDGR